MIKRLIIFIFVLLCVNISFVVVHYYADLRPVTLVKDQIKHAWKTGNLSDHEYTVFDFGYPSIYSTIGIDHYTDCFIDLMAMYRSDEPIKNAIIPGYWYKDKNLCQTRLDIANDNIPEDSLSIQTKARLWHGAKVFLLLALPRLDYYQINHLIKLSTYLLYGLIGILIALLARNTVFSYLPIMFSGIYGSGIVVHGGISNALPYLCSMTGIFALLLLTSLKRTKLIPVFTMCTGSILAFFYVMDGSLMLVLPLLTYIAYFVIYTQQSEKKRLLTCATLVFLFMFGFAGSLIFKQLISLIYQPQAWQYFLDNIIFRINGEHGGKEFTSVNSILSQLKWFHIATLGWKDYAQFMKWAGLISWLLSIVMACLYARKIKSFKPFVDFGVFMIAPVIVFMRYALIANHSTIHVIIVSRYLSVALCFGIAAMIYFLFKLLENRNTS